MIYELIPQILMVLSAAAVLFFLGRKVPSSLKDLEQETIKEDKGLEQMGIKQVREGAMRHLVRLLRRVKAFIARSDKKVVELLKKLQGNKEKKAKKKEEAEKDKLEISDPVAEEASEEVAAEQSELEQQPEPQEKSQSLKKDQEIEPPARPEKRLKKKGGFALGSLRKSLPFKKAPAKQAGIKEEPEADWRRGQRPTRPVIIPMRDINIKEARRVMFEREEKILIRKISLNPRNDDAYVALGKLYRDIGNLKDAKASLNQALKINKGNIAAKKGLRDLEAKQ